jgi:carboxymethylenebutenolidase
MHERVVCEWRDVDVGDKAMGLYVCAPEDGAAHPAVLVLQEIFGVNHHIRGVTERLARLGYVAVAPDVFHRQGDRFEAPYADLGPGRARKAALQEGAFIRDLERTLGWMRSRSDVTDRVGVVGFCMGGWLAFLAAARMDVQAAVSFYGGGIAERQLHDAPGLGCPILLLFGGRDEIIPPAQVAKIRAAVAGKQAEVIVYPDAGHGFLCDERASYEPRAAADAWTRLEQHFAAYLR